MISIRFSALALLTSFALVSLAGCTAETTGTGTGAENASQKQVIVAESTETTTADGHRFEFHHRGPGPMGPDMLVGAALRAPLDLTAEQRATIEGLAQAGGPHHIEQRHTMDPAKAKELAAAIRSGNLDSLPKPAFDDSKMKEHLAKSAASLKTLHDTLTPAQRAALVADIKSHAPKGGPVTERRVEIKLKAHGDHGPGPFGDDLNLTDAQKEQLKTKMEAHRPVQQSPAQMKANMEAMRAEMDAKLESFKGDSFDANTFVAPPANMPKLGELKGNPLADLVSVLTPEQRETLAKRIEAGPPAR